MNPMNVRKGIIGGLLLIAAILAMGGCRWAGGPGDTVDTPPRALVEKTFKPQTQAPRPDQPKAGTPTSVETGK